MYVMPCVLHICKLVDINNCYSGLWNNQGYVLGNPVTSPYYETNAKIPFSHRLALISDQLYKVKKHVARPFWGSF